MLEACHSDSSGGHSVHSYLATEAAMQYRLF